MILALSHIEYRRDSFAEDEDLSLEEAKERKIMKLLLKIKNGTPPQRKTALVAFRQLEPLRRAWR